MSPLRRRTVERLAHVTLRSRLMAVLLACLLVSCAIVAVVTSLALRRFLVDRLDQQLAAAGNRYAVGLEHPGDPDQDTDDNAFRTVPGQEVGTLGARVAGGAVTAAAVVGEPSANTAAARSALARLGPSARPRTVDLPGLGEYRLAVSRGADGDLLVTGLPEGPVDETITRLLVVEGIVFAVALLVTLGAGGLFVRLSLRPLNRVAGTALQVSELPLASGAVSIPDRVDNPAPGTEVGQVADAFNHMLEHVESALRERHASEDRLRRFIADASHELRTPVAVIRSHAEYAQRLDEALPPDVDHALARITAESNRMSVLVDDLLLLARLDAGRPLAKDTVDLTRLTLDAVRDAQVAGPDHTWRLELPDEPVQVTGDEHALHSALANLLTNARVHTPVASTVTVSLIGADPGPVRLTVADDGPGIPPALAERVFERLVHGESSSRETGGSGLGLAIVAAIVAAHGGRVDLQSRPGRTVFTVELPATDTGVSPDSVPVEVLGDQ